VLFRDEGVWKTGREDPPRGLIGVFLALLVPIGFSAARKLASTGQAGPS
jgi:hypothetical protein